MMLTAWVISLAVKLSSGCDTRSTLKLLSATGVNNSFTKVSAATHTPSFLLTATLSFTVLPLTTA